MEKEKDTLYARWLSGELTKDELSSLKESGDLDALEKIRKVTDDFAVPGFDVEEQYAKLRKNKLSPERKTRKLGLKWWTGLAASIAVIIFAGNYFLNSAEIVSAPFASNIEYVLPDDSEILINDGSEIRYNKRKYDSSRNIVLSGEALFKVKKGVPFIVSTENGNVEVLGTSFNVRSRGRQLNVECYEGSVAVRFNNQSGILEPGESISVVKGEMKEKNLIEHIQPQWKEGLSRFYQEDINEVFRELERQYNIKIRLPELDKTFNGVFKHDDLDAALSSICQPMKLEYQLDETKRIVEVSKIE
ncbi:MAG: FecR domain-containing protein [Bacteroidia bacterium]|nr:FecR domain-containing protein [Bacteroidia bacterium]NNK89545.1 DUF4974 domain-containing protein [Saprospiraceae bacterium]